MVDQLSEATDETIISCKGCQGTLHVSVAKCLHCGRSRRSTGYKNKTVAAVFAFFLGGFGAHRFYLGQWWGIFYLLFFWLWIPGFIALIEFIYFLVCDAKKWDKKYNEGMPASIGEKGNGPVIALVIIFGGFMFIALLGIVAAISIPAYQEYTLRAKLQQSHSSAKIVTHAVEHYTDLHHQLPESIDNLEIEREFITVFVDAVVVQHGTVYVTPNPDFGIEGQIIYTPSQSEAGLSWSCTHSTLADKYLPPECR